jgi:peptide/nickel transport system substrate-binding protein
MIRRRLFLAIILVFALVLGFHGPCFAGRNIITVYMEDAKDWDPHVSYSDEVKILNNIYEQLVRFEDGEVRPLLATSWEPSDGAKVWTFKLRQGVKFHNGEPFNAAAAKYSIDRIKKLDAGPSWLFKPIKEVKVVDEYTVQFICENPTAVDLIMTSYYGPYMMPPKLSEEKGSEWFQAGNTCGTGPYKRRSYEKGSAFILQKNEDYWGGWKPNQFDIAVFKVVTEPSTAVQLLKSGEMDITENVPLELRASLLKDPNIEAVLSPSTRNEYFHIHNQKPPTDDINVRKAIWHAINIDEMIEKLLGDDVVKAIGPIPYSMWGHDPNLKTYEYDPEKAKEYLKKSKYADQLPLKIELACYDPPFLSAATYIQASLKKIGIEAEMNTTPWPAAWDTYKNKEKCPHMVNLAWWADYPTPQIWLTSNWFKEDDPYFAWSYYHNPKFESLVTEGMRYEATDRKKAAEYYSQAQQILLDDAASFFWGDLKHLAFKRKEIKGYKHLPIYTGTYFIYRMYK